jgi:hypothetical protein
VSEVKKSKKAPAKKVVAKKAPAKKTVTKKAVAKKAVAKKAPAKKTVTKKAVAKKVVAKKAPSKKTVTKKAVAKKASGNQVSERRNVKVIDVEPFEVPEVPTLNSVPGITRSSERTFEFTSTEKVLPDATEIAETTGKRFGLLFKQALIVIAIVGIGLLIIKPFNSEVTTQVATQTSKTEATSEPLPSQSTEASPEASPATKSANSQNNAPTPDLQLGYLYTSTGIRLYWNVPSAAVKSIEVLYSEGNSEFSTLTNLSGSEKGIRISKVDTRGETTFRVKLLFTDGSTASKKITLRGKFSL